MAIQHLNLGTLVSFAQMNSVQRWKNKSIAYNINLTKKANFLFTSTVSWTPVIPCCKSLTAESHYLSISIDREAQLMFKCRKELGSSWFIKYDTKGSTSDSCTEYHLDKLTHVELLYGKLKSNQTHRQPTQGQVYQAQAWKGPRISLVMTRSVSFLKTLAYICSTHKNVRISEISNRQGGFRVFRISSSLKGLWLQWTQTSTKGLRGLSCQVCQ